MTWQERMTPESDEEFLNIFVDMDGDAQRMAEYFGVDHQSIRRRLRRIERWAKQTKLTGLFHEWAVANGHLVDDELDDWIVKKVVRK
jgi:hypothetical protein